MSLLTAHGRTATRSFRSVVVQRNARIIDEPNESRPMLSQTFQNLATRLAEFGVGEFGCGFGTHHLQRATQQGILLLKLRRIERMLQTFSIQVVDKVPELTLDMALQ